jgi:hypothetical protein
MWVIFGDMERKMTEKDILQWLGFFKLGGDARLRECAFDGCFQHVSYRLERDGVGSEYCEPCARKIAAMIAQDAIP